MDVEHKKTAEINPSESEEFAAPIPVDVDEFVVQVLRKCDCVTLAKYFQGIPKERFMTFTLLDIERLLPTPVTTSLKIYEEITNTNTVSAQRQEFQLIDLTLKSVSSFKPIPDGCTSSHTELALSSTPKKIKLVEYDNSDSDSDDIEVHDEPQSKRLCQQDQHESNLLVQFSESPTPACSPPASNRKTTETLQTQNRISTGPLNAAEESHSSEIDGLASCENVTPSDQNGDVIVKAEKLEFVVSSISKAEDDNDDEVLIEVTEAKLHRPINQEVVLVDVSDEETEAAEHPSPISKSQIHPSTSTTSSTLANPTSRDSLLRNRFSFVKTDTDKFIEVQIPSIHTDRLEKIKYGNMDLYAKVCTKISLFSVGGVSKKHRDCSKHKSATQNKDWIKFYDKFGPSITSIKLNSWSWDHSKSKCPFNLFKILRKNCPHLKELIFNVGPHEVGLDFEKAAGNGWVQFQQLGNLPALRKIVVHVNAINSKKVPVVLLQNILKASPNLEELSYEFRGCADARKLLTTLSSFGSEFLEKMKVLRILFADVSKKSGRLCEKDMKLLNGVQAQNLQEMFLTFDILEDMDSEENCIEALFLNFPFLKKFVVRGTYYRDCSASPSDANIIVQIPASLHLEHLEIYGFSEFESVIESPITNVSSFQGQLQCLHNELRPRKGQTRDTVGKELDPVMVSVAIPHLMPKLKTIILDAWVEIEEMHFRSIPQIATFRVESQWHLSAKLPSENSRKNCFPFLAELQIPNYLEDEYFLLSLPQRFQNLTKCWISLLSVKGLRCFFKTMASSKLETLILCTRFYLESSLQVCFFGGMRMTAGQLEDERKKWDELRKYGMFQEFIASNYVESPCWEIIDELRDNEKYAELSALKHLKNLEMEHVPMVLRIPKGDADWRGPEAEFTQSCVGFKKYPLSKTFIDHLPSWMHFSKGTNIEIVEQGKDCDNSNDGDRQVHQEETE